MTQPFQKKPFGWHIAGRAWISAPGALLGLLPFYAVMIGVMFAAGYGLHLLEAKLGVIRPRNDTILTEMVMRESWYYALAWGLRILLLAPVAVATLRYVLVDDGPRLAPGPLLRFWGWTVSVCVFSLGALYLAGLVSATPAFGLLVIVSKVFAFGLPALLALAFAASAAGAPAGARIETALEGWEGNIWRFVLAFALTLGPLYLASRLLDNFIARRGTEAATAFQEGLPGIAVIAVLSVLAVLLFSATLAWCYAWAQERRGAVTAVTQPAPAGRREPVAR
jgi:hypothetical protein